MNYPKDKLQELKKKIDHYQVDDNSKQNSSKKLWTTYWRRKEGTELQPHNRPL